MQAMDGPFFLCSWPDAVTGDMGEKISITVPIPRSAATLVQMQRQALGRAIELLQGMAAQMDASQLTQSVLPQST